MRRLWLGVGALAVGVAGILEFTACDASFDICEGSQCPGFADGGGDGSDGQVVPTGCDLTKDPKDSAACVDESIGLFVSAGGSDSNAGTKKSPLKSITAALGKIDGQHTRVYVCEGTYGEMVKVTSSVGVYGGFHCADWSYVGGFLSQVKPTGQGYALDIENVKGVTIEDLEFDAQKGQNPGDSSIAVFVATSTATLRRVTATAGDGAAGADVMATSNYDGGAAPTGNSALTDAGAGNFGATTCENRCVDGTVSLGGAGGGGGLGGGLNGADGGPAIPPLPNDGAHDGAGGIAPGCHIGANAGATGAAADGGSKGAAAAGHLTSTGWMGVEGSAGDTAGVGQGGGGGGGGVAATNTGGGGGGCGGCGGAGGAGGNSGGSSYALLAYQATLTLDTCTLQAGNGADGKAGGSGQVGQTGGFKGSAVPTVGTGCDGAPGGKGGDGAGGGGGAGGNSIAVGYAGTKPTVTATTYTEGTFGAAGAGGPGAAGNNGLPGAPGTKADIQELP